MFAYNSTSNFEWVSHLFIVCKHRCDSLSLGARIPSFRQGSTQYMHDDASQLSDCHTRIGPLLAWITCAEVCSAHSLPSKYYTRVLWARLTTIAL